MDYKNNEERMRRLLDSNPGLKGAWGNVGKSVFGNDWLCKYCTKFNDPAKQYCAYCGEER